MSLSGGNNGWTCILLKFASRQSRRICFFRHRIVAKLPRQRMAPQQPLQTHPRPLQHAKPLDRLIRIQGASRLEPATSRKQDRQIHLINTYRCQRRFHRSRLARAGGRGKPRPYSLCEGVNRPRWDRLQSVLFSRAVFATHAHRCIHTLLINRTKSAVSATNSARATLFFG
jgi:hypothetical protein